jgi:hypothetical protein
MSLAPATGFVATPSIACSMRFMSIGVLPQ